ncbi:pyruvoyl-dependent arginine decarboxylase [Natranaerobius thermophilus]|uniref:Pyruvoyl-dependent arginine decarboxylase AaxB n=1 Tax=Natranaerobius thermophilus (strain ATCC BAA-1301 / DSM 18059 / JW/NM-WN-LF) TaxID=457570 RepID=B2A8A5_NATTJ|nr:pyruvoyl-dependent arginine decarboxylase [Natranaerobius thermophilus]ACB84471.1 Pyruvoyl-dependent arginine decarboxylase [Natranaerobius thermophilus JW/NM-WN-LF]
MAVDLKTLKYFKLVTGTGEGNTSLTAFDKALLNAEVGNFNLLKVTSILPARVKQKDKITVSEGGILPIAYGSVTSCNSGEIISSAVAVGIPASSRAHGMIVETSGYRPKEQSLKIAENMIAETFENRGLELQEVLTKGSELKIRDISCGSVFSGVALF